MNILMLCDEYPPGRHGGIGTAVQLLAREYVQLGHNVVVAGFYPRGYGEADYFLDEGVEVYRFRYGLPGLIAQERFWVKVAYKLLRYSGVMQLSVSSGLKRYGLQLRQLIMQHQIDICEMPDFQSYMPFVTRFTIFPKLQVPLIVKLHGTLTYFARETGEEPAEAIFQSERQVLQNATAVSSVSQYTATQTAHYFDYKPVIKILYNGIALSALKHIEKSIPQQTIFSGTLVRKKGIYQLMKAWNMVSMQLPEAQLKVYGKGPVAEVATLLMPEARASVAFFGHTPRETLMDALSAATVAVFPSYAECFALAPMEAMAAGTAVIYSTRTSGPELITDGVDGLLADPDNVEGLAQKIVFLLCNPHFCSEIARKGRETLLQNFEINHISRQHIDYYWSVIQSASIESNA